MPVPYELEGFNGLAHLHVAYATDETLVDHTSCCGLSFTQAFLVACGSIARVLIVPPLAILII